MGMIIILAVGLMIAFAFLPTIASNQAAITNTQSIVNESLSAAQFVDGVNYALLGHDVTGFTMINGSSGALYNSGNYTITSRVIQSDGLIKDIVTPTATSRANATAVKVSYTYSPDGYIDDGAARSVTQLILLFVVLGIVVFAIWGSNLKEAFSDFGM